MIILENYSKKNTYIAITSEGYSIINANSITSIESGVGGFSEDNGLLGIYVQGNRLDKMMFELIDNERMPLGCFHRCCKFHKVIFYKFFE